MCQGLEAVPTHTLRTIPGKHPRLWNISPDALHVVVGYVTGHLQVHYGVVVMVTPDQFIVSIYSII